LLETIPKIDKANDTGFQIRLSTTRVMISLIYGCLTGETEILKKVFAASLPTFIFAVPFKVGLRPTPAEN
jgi:hypothetical protein